VESALKRDVDLLRKLLLQIEDRERPSWKDLTKDMSDSDAENVLQHINMLAEAGLIRGLRVPLHGFVLWQDLELTFEGHEFIEAVRNENTWEANKRKAKSLALSDLASAQKIEGSHALHENEKIFLVHGHDDAMKHSVARFIKDVCLVPIILSEQPNKGAATIIEKFERNSDVGFAVVLLSGDDVGGKTASNLKERARQNVIMELGYFMGRLNRSRVCALKKDEVEIPSDILGVTWVPFDVNEGWKMALARELKAAGYTIDLNRVVNP
jgi:predicted nucleotide-binding protein